MEHIGEDGKALLSVGIIYVLAQEVVEVVASAIRGFQHLHQSEVGVAAGEFGEVGGVGEGFGADAGNAGGGRNSQRCAGLDHGFGAAKPKQEVSSRDEEKNQRRDKHSDGVRREGDDEVADGDGAKDAAECADGGDSPHLRADGLRGLSQCPDGERSGDGQQGKRDKEESKRSQRRADCQVKSQAKVGHWLEGGNGKAKVESGQQNTIVEAMEFGRAVGQPAAKKISSGKGNQGDGNLRCPDEVRGAKERGEHFGAENFDDEYDSASCGGREVKVSAETTAQPGFCRCWLALFHGRFLAGLREKIKPQKMPRERHWAKGFRPF